MYKLKAKSLLKWLLVIKRCTRHFWLQITGNIVYWSIFSQLVMSYFTQGGIFFSKSYISHLEMRCQVFTAATFSVCSSIISFLFNLRSTVISIGKITTFFLSVQILMKMSVLRAYWMRGFAKHQITQRYLNRKRK